MDAFMLFFPWWKKSRFIRFQCVKLFCTKIWSCKVFYLHLWWYFLLYSHLVCFEQACFFLKIPFKSWNLNCHSKQVDEWVCTFSVFQFSLKCSPGLHPLLGIPRLAVSLGDENISYTGCFFSKGPTQKSSKYGIGPSQQNTKIQNRQVHWYHPKQPEEQRITKILTIVLSEYTSVPQNSNFLTTEIVC